MKLFNKKSNKGFSLVELIIVIAIMAILVGIVGTQVIPYIEKSRVSKDQQVMSALCTDGTTAFATCASQLTPSVSSYELKIDSNATPTMTPAAATDTGSAAVLAEFQDLNNFTDLASLGLCSNVCKNVDYATITYDSTTEKIYVHFHSTSNQAKVDQKLPTITN